MMMGSYMYYGLCSHVGPEKVPCKATTLLCILNWHSGPGLMQPFKAKFDVVTANPPYIIPGDRTRFRGLKNCDERRCLPGLGTHPVACLLAATSILCSHCYIATTFITTWVWQLSGNSQPTASVDTATMSYVAGPMNLHRLYKKGSKLHWV